MNDIINNCQKMRSGNMKCKQRDLAQVVTRGNRMTKYKTLESLLDEMWRRRKSVLLRSLSIKGLGKPLKWNKKLRNQLIGEAKAIAGEKLRKDPLVLREYYSIGYTPKPGRKFLKGAVIRRKQREAQNWLDTKVEDGLIRNAVYVLYRKRKCLYVGKTSTGGNRFRAHHHPDSWKNATRIDIILPYDKRNLEKLECMSIHILKPAGNRRPEHKCDICERLDDLDHELNWTFQFQ